MEDQYSDTPYEDQTELPYDGGGWPGDGSGTDDLADMMQNESDDYCDEGGDDYGDDDGDSQEANDYCYEDGHDE